MSSKVLTAQEIIDIIRDRKLPLEEKQKIVRRELNKLIDGGRNDKKDEKKQ